MIEKNNKSDISEEELAKSLTFPTRKKSWEDIKEATKNRRKRDAKVLIADLLDKGYKITSFSGYKEDIKSYLNSVKEDKLRSIIKEEMSLEGFKKKIKREISDELRSKVISHINSEFLDRIDNFFEDRDVEDVVKDIVEELLKERLYSEGD